MNRYDIFKLVVIHICEVIPELENHEFKPSDRLVDLGANSIERVEIIMMLMEDLKLNIPKVELSGAKNIGELADALYEKSN